MRLDRNRFTCSYEGGKKNYNDFDFGTFIGRFPSDCAASMAVKGLMSQVTAGQEVESEVGLRKKRKGNPTSFSNSRPAVT